VKRALGRAIATVTAAVSANNMKEL
jgi:hypothetical protein